MNSYEQIIKDITNKIFANFDIALMAIMYWIIKSPGMTDAHLADVMSRLGYTFNTTTMVLNDGTRDYTVLQMLQNTISNIYVNTNLSPEMLELIITKCTRKGYITAEEAQTLIDSLATVVGA